MANEMFSTLPADALPADTRPTAYALHLLATVMASLDAAISVTHELARDCCIGRADADVVRQRCRCAIADVNAAQLRLALPHTIYRRG